MHNKYYYSTTTSRVVSGMHYIYIYIFIYIYYTMHTLSTCVCIRTMHNVKRNSASNK